MGVIVKRVRFEGSRGVAEVEALFDSGASMSFIRRGLAERLGKIDELPRLQRFETAKAGEILEVAERVRLDFYLDGDRLSDEFLVLPDEVATEEVIVGASTLQKWRLVLDFEKEDVYSVRKVKKHMLKKLTSIKRCRWV